MELCSGDLGWAQQETTSHAAQQHSVWRTADTTSHPPPVTYRLHKLSSTWAHQSQKLRFRQQVTFKMFLNIEPRPPTWPPPVLGKLINTACNQKAQLDALTALQPRRGREGKLHEGRGRWVMETESFETARYEAQGGHTFSSVIPLVQLSNVWTVKWLFYS